MNNTTHAATASKPTGPRQKRRYLSAEKKFQIYLETQHRDQPVGEILRREGLFSTDLARIRQQVKEGALARLSAKPGRQLALVSSAAYELLKTELQEKERALADLAVELTLLRKKTNGVSSDRSPTTESMRPSSKPSST
jgi:transposase-like protein